MSSLSLLFLSDEENSKRLNLLVSKWVRKTLKTQYPTDLINLIYKYWKPPNDSFDTSCMGKDIILKDNIVTCKNESYINWNMIYGIKIFSEGKHRWKFKIIQMPTKEYWGNGSIGITKASTAKVFKDSKFDGYGFSPSYGPLYNKNTSLLFVPAFSQGKDYGPLCKQGDMIEMLLDMDNRSMYFIINGIEYKNAFKEGEIEQNEYRMAICVGNNQCKIEYLDYE